MERKTFVYIGPDKPFGLPIMRNTVLADDPEKVFPALTETFREHPKLRKLFIPSEKLAEALAAVKKSGSPLNIFVAEIGKASKNATQEAK